MGKTNTPTDGKDNKEAVVPGVKVMVSLDTEPQILKGEKKLHIVDSKTEIEKDDLVSFCNMLNEKENHFADVEAREVIEVEINPAEKSVREKHNDKFELANPEQVIRIATMNGNSTVEEFFTSFKKKFSGKLIYFGEVTVH
jgi:hypothetical protein